MRRGRGSRYSHARARVGLRPISVEPLRSVSEGHLMNTETERCHCDRIGRQELMKMLGMIVGIVRFR